MVYSYILYSFFGLSTIFLLLYNFIYWKDLNGAIRNRLKKDTTKYHAVFPNPESMYITYNRIRTNPRDFDPKVLSSIWNKNSYYHVVKLPVVTAKLFTDIKFYNRMISILPYFNILWFLVNIMLFGIIYVFFLILQIDIPANNLSSLISIPLGLVSLAFLIMNKWSMKKYFGTDDMFYIQGIETEYVVVLNEDRP